MGLLDDVRAAQRGRTGGPRCSLAPVLAAMTKAERADLVAALADSAIFATSIENVLKARGHKIGASTIGRHRRGQCSCGDGAPS